MAFAGNKSVIRQSKFRHTYAEYSQYKYDDVRSPAKAAVEGGFGLSASDKLIAVPSPVGGASGAALMFVPVDNTQINRLQVQNLFSLHNGCGITDFEFDPFRSNRLATSGEDSLIKLWEIPTSASSLSESNIVRDQLLVLEGGTKKITCIKFNAVVDNCLATAAYDGTTMVWDLEKKTYITKVDGKDACQSLDWDFFGNTLCGVYKDKCLRVVDPRQESVALESANSHKGNKSSRALWLSGRNQPTDSGNFIVSCGFSNQAKREMFLWDTRKFERPVWTNNIDDNSGVIYPYFDECTGLLFLVGRGDGNIRYYEFADSSIFYINDHRSTTPQRGFCLYPKRVVEKEKNEVVRCLKLENTCIQTLSFLVPRRADVGSADLYPPCPNGLPAIPSVDSWLIRGDGALVPPSMDGMVTPGASPRVSVTGQLAVSPLANSTRTNIPPIGHSDPNQVSSKHTDEEFKQLKHQLIAAHKQIEEQQNKIQRLENIVMSVQEPALSPPPRRPQTMEQLEAMEELKMEVTILKEKVVKLMNENARLRMNFSSSVSRPLVGQPAPGNPVTMAQIPAPPPIHPVARSPIRPSPTMGI